MTVAADYAGSTSTSFPRGTRDERLRRGLLYVVIFIVAIARLLTETLGILPRAINLADIPLFFFACAVLIFRNGPSEPGCQFFRRSLSRPLKGFSLCAVLSIMVNGLFYGIHLLPAISFLIFHLEPMVFALLFLRLGWAEHDTQTLATLLLGIGLLQIPMSLLQLSTAFSEDNPDLASGTFGTNGSQMCFFLILVIAYLLGRYLMEASMRWLLPIIPLVIVFYAQGFKAMWLPFVVTMAVPILLFSPRVKRKKVLSVVLILVVAIFIAFPVGMATSSQTMQFMRWEYANDVLRSGAIWELGKIQAFLNISRLYRDAPLSAFVGVGPGSFSSRAFLTFTEVSPDPEAPTNVTHGYIEPIAPGVFAEKYVVPLVFKSEILFGSSTIDGPYNSYVSLMGEVGLIGFALYFLVYYRVFRRAITAAREAKRQGNPLLFAISIAAICGCLTIAQMAFLDNWVEVSRVTLPLWLLLLPVISSHGALPYVEDSTNNMCNSREQ